MPEREDDYLTPATRLLEKRRELTEVEQALSAQREVTTAARGLAGAVPVNLRFVIPKWWGPRTGEGLGGHQSLEGG